MAEVQEKEVAAAAKKKAESDAAKSDRLNALAPHLSDSKVHFQQLLREKPAHEHEPLAKRFGWHVLDLKCKSGHCDAEVKDHVVDVRSSIADDLRVLPCAKCGARGQWDHVVAPKPKAPVAKEK